MEPKRIQRRRTKGWRMPEGVVYVGRPSKWGNPIEVSADIDRATAVRYFREYVIDNLPDFAQLRAELAGRDLACWCPLDQPCHADVLLEIANEGD